jgi:hypothetical protein
MALFFLLSCNINNNNNSNSDDIVSCPPLRLQNRMLQDCYYTLHVHVAFPSPCFVPPFAALSRVVNAQDQLEL